MKLFLICIAEAQTSITPRATPAAALDWLNTSKCPKGTHHLWASLISPGSDVDEATYLSSARVPKSILLVKTIMYGSF